MGRHLCKYILVLNNKRFVFFIIVDCDSHIEGNNCHNRQGKFPAHNEQNYDVTGYCHKISDQKR